MLSEQRVRGVAGRSGGSQVAGPLRSPRARIQAAAGLPRWRSDDRLSWRCRLSAFRAPPRTCRQVHLWRSSLLQQEMGQCGCVAAGKKYKNRTHTPTAYDGLQMCRAVGSTDKPLPHLRPGAPRPSASSLESPESRFLCLGLPLASAPLGLPWHESFAPPSTSPTFGRKKGDRGTDDDRPLCRPVVRTSIMASATPASSQSQTPRLKTSLGAADY